MYNRIMKMDEYKDSIWYRSACACGSNECDLDIMLEYEDDMLSIVFYNTLRASSYYGTTNWFKEKLNRLQMCLKILFTGHIKAESEFIFKDDEHVKDFIAVLTTGAESLVVNKVIED